MSPKSTELPVVDMVMNDIALTRPGFVPPAIIPLVVELTVDSP